MEKKDYVLSVYTENQVGLLNRIAAIFSRRKINIERLNVTPSSRPGVHVFTILVNETAENVRKVAQQINKQVEAFEVSVKGGSEPFG